MIQPTVILPTLPMARRLAVLRPADRAAAAIAMCEAGDLEADVQAGLEEALRPAGGMVEAADSDRPWALALGCVRDLAAFAVVAFGGAYAWAILA